MPANEDSKKQATEFQKAPITSHRKNRGGNKIKRLDGRFV